MPPGVGREVSVRRAVVFVPNPACPRRRTERPRGCNVCQGFFTHGSHAFGMVTNLVGTDVRLMYATSSRNDKALQ